MPATKGALVFHNGTVFDGVRFLPGGTHVRVHDGKIAAVGTASALGPGELVDLAGGTLLPGFIDAHAHPVYAGEQLLRCDLSAERTAAGYAAIIAAYARDHPQDEWITGGGWSM